MSSANKFLFALVVLFTGIACQRAEHDPLAENPDYFPLQVGDYWDYQVTQATFSSAGSVVTNQYQIRERINSSYTQNGQTFFIMEEAKKMIGQTTWQLTTLRTVYKNSFEVVSLENNVPVVQLVFPVTSTTSWNANRYNAQSDTTLHYEAIGRPLVIDSLVFPRTVDVTGDDDSTLIDRQKYHRIYAYQTGLVYREEVAIAYCQSTPDCLGKTIIDHGVSQIWRIIATNRH